MQKLNNDANKEEIIEKVNEIIHLLELQREAEIELLKAENRHLRNQKDFVAKFVNIRNSEVENVIQ